MKNKNQIFRIVSLLLVLCFISTVMISGTFAKYTSVYSGHDTALIAKWSLDVKGGSVDFDLGDDATAELDLFSHEYDKYINQKVKVGDDDIYIIAPGVDGEFVLSVTNNSDVAAEVEFGFTASGADVPMQFSLVAFDDEAFIQHVSRIIVFSREEIGFILKCGITLRERM